MNLKTLFIFLNTLTVGAIFILISILVEYEDAYARMDRSYTQRHDSYMLADELRQSSDDLTRLVRTYVITQNPRFKEQYNKVLDIRNGLSPRPENYNKVYWDLLAVESAPVTEENNESSTQMTSLKDRMVAAGFTNEELSALRQSHQNSDKLVDLEKRAMQIVEGVYMDKNGSYTKQEKPNLQLARDLLHSNEYHHAKVQIMAPINTFLSLLETRTNRSILEAKNYAASVEEKLSLMVFFLILIMLVSIASMFHRIIYPLLSLKRYMLKLATNDLSTVTPSHRHKDEVYDMISAVEIFKDNTEKLIISEQKVKLLFDSAGEGFLGLDSRGVFTFINPVACEILGYTQEELIGTYFYKILSPHTFTTRMSKLFLNDDSGKNTGIIELHQKNNKMIPVEFTSTPIFTQDNELDGSVILFTDITQRRKDEEALELAKENAEAANKVKTLFLANMSHELRSPLNVILGFSRLMLKDYALQKQQRENLETIHQSGEHLLNIISEILQISKLQAGKLEINNNAFDLHHFLDNIKLIMTRRSQAKGLVFTYDTYASLPQTVICDEQRLRQILFNLLGNAIKFTEKGKIHLGLKHKNNMLSVEVSDTGLGISEENLAIIFKPFEQIRSSGYEQKGTGLGLAITKELITLMGGDIHVQSSLEKGSHFTFCIPSPIVATQPSKLLDYTSELMLSTDTNVFKVLIVDDIDKNRSLLVQMMQQLGFEICEAKGGKEVIKQLQVHHPDIIFMDIQMPDMNGLEVTEQIRSDNRYFQIPIVLVSANVFDENRQAALNRGANIFLEKPITEEEVVSTLHKLLPLKIVTKKDTSAKEIQAPLRTTILSEIELKTIIDAANNLDSNQLTYLFEKYHTIDKVFIRHLKKPLHEYNFSEIIHICRHYINQSSFD